MESRTTGRKASWPRGKHAKEIVGTFPSHNSLSLARQQRAPWSSRFARLHTFWITLQSTVFPFLLSISVLSFVFSGTVGFFTFSGTHFPVTCCLSTMWLTSMLVSPLLLSVLLWSNAEIYSLSAIGYCFLYSNKIVLQFPIEFVLKFFY